MKYKGLKIYKPSESRVVLITGGTGVLGSATVRVLAKSNWNVAFQYFRNEKKAKTLVDELSSSGVTVKAFKCDLRGDSESIASFVSSAEKAFKGIDAFIHCSAPPVEVSGFNSEGIEAFRKMNELNAEAFLKVIGCCLPGMKQRQNGVIIGILTEAILYSGIPTWSAYSAAKLALTSYCRDLASYVEHMGIRVIGILPGAFKVDDKSSPQAALPQEIQQAIKRQWPIGIEPESIARLIADILENKEHYKNKSFIAINAQDGVRDLSRFGFFLASSKVIEHVADTGHDETRVKQETDDPLRQELARVFREVFKLGKNDPVEDAQLGSWAIWDSLRHIELLMSVEQAMRINFLEADVASLTTFWKMLDAVKRLKK
jgi:3-oxoacyl-[acyl-carrier protein] reductase